MQQSNSSSSPLLLALVGMPGSGKSETAAYFRSVGFSLIRFGDATEEGLKEKGLPVTPENEEMYRQELRQILGMEAYAVKAEPKIRSALANGENVILDGLYSWEEYKYLISHFPTLKLIHIYAEPTLRYQRLSTRKVRPFTPDQARARDFSEIENLNKGGPIALSDYLLVNDEELTSLHDKIENLIERLEKQSV